MTSNNSADCPLFEGCGGCLHRGLSETAYRELKVKNLQRLLTQLPVSEIRFGEPVFIPDGTRRRAVMTFRRRKNQLIMGFNAMRSDEVVPVSGCPLLTPALNSVLPRIKELLAELCLQPFPPQKKHKKIIPEYITAGDVALCEAANGIDVVLEIDAVLGLDHRMTVFEHVSSIPEIIRVSWRCHPSDEPEPIIEKVKPVINIAGREVYIPAGTFLQASGEGEKALIGLVLKYLGDTHGRIADLFCGVGTFSYPLSVDVDNKILAIDSSEPLLNGFRRSVNKNMIPNIEIKTRNLFKYPLDENELTGFDAVVFDPPRAGAETQVKQLASLPPEKRPLKIIAVSCNPHSFVRDAGILLAGGYKLVEVTLVDQFTYSNHSELVALFTK